MEFIFSNRFKKEYQKLSQEEKTALQNKLRIMAQNPFHPSLRSKKIQGKEGIFECSINMEIRMTWQYEGDKIFLRAIGAHDYTLKNP
jgi:mRNA-degrading endonuclease YafQ of YafQ-DinJ toxin-antitoxin module